MKDDPNSRFNRLLKAMLGGPAPSAQKSEASETASDAEPPACCDDTQTPQDTSKDVSS